MQYFIKGNYYFDIDRHNQLRVTGPENHLMIGVPFPPTVSIEIREYDLVENNLRIVVICHAQALEIPIPLVTDIRTLREYTEQTEEVMLYHALSKNLVQDLLPQKVSVHDNNEVDLLNSYEDEGDKKQYGTRITIRNGSLKHEDNLLKFATDQKNIELEIMTLGNVAVKNAFAQPLFVAEIGLPEDLIAPEIKILFDNVKSHIEHLILTRKTSSLEYGTIFPRDWIESADLGNGDFNQETVEYMYEQSMNHISELGEGWHEELVGAYKTKFPDKRLHIDRKMIDIEPHYLLGLPLFSSNFSHREDIKNKLKLVSEYVVHNARDFSLISFKRMNDNSQDFHHVGNWRDSFMAFTKQIAPLAPYDVNCVFYPSALRVMREFAGYLELDEAELDQLIEKWDKNKIRYRLYHDDILGYSLALHSKKRLPLPIAHLDEAYDLFYGTPSMEETVSFAKKIVDPEYFYTPVGPILVSSDDSNFSTKEYHGKVIWPKQAAFAVAGLTKQLFKGLENNWPGTILDEIHQAALTTAEACFRGWTELQAVPELYYYDEIEDRARLYTDQAVVEGQMSIIQLWSAVGCRRIIRDYVKLKGYQLKVEQA